MSAVAVVRELLAANSSLIAVVPAARIVAGPIPEGSALPAISVLEIVTTEIPHIDAQSPNTIVDGQVQVTIVAATYPAMKAAHVLARKACNYQRGTINGFSVISVRRLANGPDMSDASANLCMQSIDFSVLYQEPN